MLEPGGDLHLAREAARAHGGGDLGPQDLQGDLPVVLEVLGEIDGGHAALPELALEAIAVVKGGLQLGERLGHGDGSIE
jgi:hypothetical protein